MSENDVANIQSLFPDKVAGDILIDLRHTSSVEATINRILDNTFLNGTSKDPSLDVIVIDDNYEPPPMRPSQPLRTFSGILAQTMWDMRDDLSRLQSFSPQGASRAGVRSNSGTLVTSVIDLSKTPAASHTPQYSGKENTLNHFNSGGGFLISDDDDDDADLLPSSLALSSVSTSVTIKPQQSSTRTMTDAELFFDGGPGSSDSDDSAPIPAKRKRKSTEYSLLQKSKKEEEKLRKAAEREEKKRQKEAEKVQKKEEKEREREEKRLQKQMLADQKRREVEEVKAQVRGYRDVNKLRDKHASVQDMILDIDPYFINQRHGVAIVSGLKEIGVDVTIKPQPLAGAIRWRRKVKREWNDEGSKWVPCEEKVVMEPWVLVRIDAKHLSAIILGSSPQEVLPIGSLEGSSEREKDMSVPHIEFPLRGIFNACPVAGPSARAKILLDFIKTCYPGYRVIIMVENLKGFLRDRNKTMDTMLRNEIRNRDGVAKNSRTKSGAPQASSQLASKQDFEAAFFWMQFQGFCHVHQIDKQEELTKIITSFTYTLGMIPDRIHRSEQALSLNFGDTVKSGKDREDTWRKILMAVPQCTEDRANAIIERYSSFRSLHEAYESLQSKSARDMLLENIQVAKIGGQGKRIGPALSKKIHEVITGMDENVPMTELGVVSKPSKTQEPVLTLPMMFSRQ
ncbi:hypothetical protein HDU97_005749 [Phlyctochytrium planicorne]|nr:hypothetical protein HDU97_005749 [Phlyctochytrium planicorne]